MKKVLLSTFALLATTAVNAGSLVYTAPEVIAIEEPARMGGSGAWIIPLIIVSVLILTLTGDDDESEPNGVQPNGATF